MSIALGLDDVLSEGKTKLDGFRILEGEENGKEIVERIKSGIGVCV